MERQTIIFIGKSGCGKGTQADKLIEYINSKDDKSVFHLEAGQRFRDFITKDKSYASDLSKKINEEGALQPAFLSVWAWGGELVRELDKDEHLIVDGTPRRLVEAPMINEALEFFGRENKAVIYLNVDDDVATERLQNRGRSDDLDIRDIVKRLDWFKTDVEPVIDVYRDLEGFYFIEIDGSKSVEDIHENIKSFLGI